MPRAYLIRSIPLSYDTRNAWKAAGAMFYRRDRSAEYINHWHDGSIPIVNLGNMDLEGVSDQFTVYNRPRNVRHLVRPVDTRRSELSQHLPFNGYDGPGYYWVKLPGRAGIGKKRIQVRNIAGWLDAVDYAGLHHGDVCIDVPEIHGEFRVITVGTKVVQASRRTDARLTDGGMDARVQRSYEWVGVQGLPSNLKTIAKAAASTLDGDNVIGWDMYTSPSGDGIFEGNTCPGMNEATAGRILDAIEGVRYDAA